MSKLITIEIKSLLNGKVLFSHTCERNTIAITLSAGIKVKANLRYANLSSANLRSADLSSADLRSADLSSADLSSANLRYANLSSANLSSANLRYADLHYANLSSANLRSADLRSADLSSADLRSADLSSADLSSADLRSADLSSADLSSATGNGREVISFQSLEYSGVYSLEFMWIGCRKHPTKTWWKDSEKEAHKFSPDDIAWREKNQAWIKGLVKNNPAVATGHEGKEKSNV